MMNKCKDCKFWEKDFDFSTLTWGKCSRLNFYTDTGMITIDYDNSSDALITEQHFGCTSWKEKEEAESPQTDEPFRVQGIPMRGFIVRTDDDQFPLYWEGRQGADLACNWLNDLLAGREKEERPQAEPSGPFSVHYDVLSYNDNPLRPPVEAYDLRGVASNPEGLVWWLNKMVNR